MNEQRPGDLARRSGSGMSEAYEEASGVKHWNNCAGKILSSLRNYSCAFFMPIFRGQFSTFRDFSWE